MNDEELHHLLSYVRMSTGFGIYEMSEVIAVNDSLMRTLQNELK